MKAVRLAMLVGVVLFGVLQVRAQVELPPAAKEVLDQAEREALEVEQKADAELKVHREKLSGQLKKLQDAYCREAKLDEAVAIRDLIRSLRAGSTPVFGENLPADARDVCKAHEEEQAENRKKADLEIERRREKIVTELKKLQDAYCREAKLDDAVAVRDLIRNGVSNALPDPGYVNDPQTNIGRVYYYHTTGATTGGQIYGTEVFTTGSHLGMAAVHSGILKEGQKGVVKVTILAGQGSYPSTTRNGITSQPWQAYNVSFKVERVPGFVLLKQPVNPVRDEK
jgi:hypothetical protein